MRKESRRLLFGSLYSHKYKNVTLTFFVTREKCKNKLMSYSRVYFNHLELTLVVEDENIVTLIHKTRQKFEKLIDEVRGKLNE